jgi:hypothetical protein
VRPWIHSPVIPSQKKKKEKKKKAGISSTRPEGIIFEMHCNVSVDISFLVWTKPSKLIC